MTVEYTGRNGRKSSFKAKFEGVIPNLERRYRETNSEHQRGRIAEFMSDRLAQPAAADRLRKKPGRHRGWQNIVEVTKCRCTRAGLGGELSSGDTPFNHRDTLIAERILKEIKARLGFLVNVGLDYLTLQRSAGSLSGGEAQRIRLATQIGSRLMGVLYVLDEPSIGLHPRDNERLLVTLEGMRDLGNTVLVVEHDEETIRRADWIVDLGPGAGDLGGEVIAEGPPEDIINNPNSLTVPTSPEGICAVPERRMATASICADGCDQNT